MTSTLERLREKGLGVPPPDESRFETPAPTPMQQMETVANPSSSFAERVRARQSLAEQGQHMPSPTAIDRSSREAFLAQQVGSETLAQPGMTDLLTRADLSLSDTFEEKKTKFLSKFPDGDFVQVFEPRSDPSQRNSTILFRRHPNEEYAELDARVLDRAEFLGDAADISGELPAAAMEALFIRGGRIGQQMWQATVGTLTGDAIKEAIESARGFQKETLPQVMSREATRAVLSAAGAGATVAVSGPINAVRGASTIALKPSARLAQRAATRFDMPPLLPGQVARSPFLQKMQGQASAIFKTVGDYVSAQQGAMARAMGRLREGDVKKVLADELENLFEEGKDQIVKAAMVAPNRTLTEGGTAIQAGIAEWDDFASMMTRWAYRRAEQIEEPKFNLTPLKAMAQELKAGIQGAREGGGTIDISKLDPKLERVVDSILALDPNLPAVEINGLATTATDQLRALRTQLWDLKMPDKGQIARQPEKDAGKLYSALTRVLRTPTNSNPEFAAMWRKADALASSRFSAMEQLMVIDAAKSETPALLAKELIKPNQVDNLRVLKGVMPDSKWNEFQSAVKAEMIAPQNIDGLTKRLDTFDEQTLNMLLPKADQETLRLIGQRIDQFKQIGIKQAMAQDATFAGLIESLAVRNDTQSIARLVEESLKRPKLRRSIRAGLMERVWNQASSVNAEGVRTVNANAIRDAIQSLRQSGAIHFLDFGDIRTLKNLEVLAGLIPESADSGTSLVAASGVSSVTRFSIEGMHSAIKHMTIGRILTSKWLQRTLLGSGKKPLPFKSLRNFGSFLGRELQDLPQGDQATMANIPPPPVNPVLPAPQ